MGKYYAVKKGRQPGIYQTWPEAQKMVTGFAGAKFKSFTTHQAAQDYLTGTHRDEPLANIATDTILVYTDGGSRNTGNKKAQHVHADDKAAWAYLIQNDDQQISKSGGEWGATNNRMEIMALLSALHWLVDSQLQSEPITVISDSHYVLDAINKHWLFGWQKRNWQTSSGSAVKNVELWKEILQILPAFKRIQFKWTKGHADNHGNVFVDHLLNQTMDRMTDPQQRAPQPEPLNQAPLQKQAAGLKPKATSQNSSPATKSSVDSIINGLKNLGIDVNMKEK